METSGEEELQGVIGKAHCVQIITSTSGYLLYGLCFRKKFFKQIVLVWSMSICKLKTHTVSNNFIFTMVLLLSSAQHQTVKLFSLFSLSIPPKHVAILLHCPFVMLLPLWFFCLVSQNVLQQYYEIFKASLLIQLHLQFICGNELSSCDNHCWCFYYIVENHWVLTFHQKVSTREDAQLSAGKLGISSVKGIFYHLEVLSRTPYHVRKRDLPLQFKKLLSNVSTRTLTLVGLGV